MCAVRKHPAGPRSAFRDAIDRVVVLDRATPVTEEAADPLAFS
jgi:hypothetical protein